MAEVNMIDLESAIHNMEGDVLLLNLAVKDVFEAKKEPDASGWYTYQLTSDQVKALMYADSRVFTGMRALDKLFYGEESGA